jgi:hypothetical protein
LPRTERAMIIDWDAEANYALGEATFDKLEVQLTGIFNRSQAPGEVRDQADPRTTE